MAGLLSSAGMVVAFVSSTAVGCASKSEQAGASRAEDSTVASAQPPVTYLSTRERTQLGAAPVRVVLPPVAEGNAFATQLARFGPSARFYIILRDLRAEIPPGVLYELYLDVEPGQSPKVDDARRIGSINFYDANRPAGAENFRRFDVTALVRQLSGERRLTTETALTLVPNGVVDAGANPTIGKIELMVEGGGR